MDVEMIDISERCVRKFITAADWTDYDDVYSSISNYKQYYHPLFF